MGKLPLLDATRAGLFIVTRSFLTRPYSPRATLEGRPTVSEPPAFGFMGTGFSDTVARPGFFHRIFIAKPVRPVSQTYARPGGHFLATLARVTLLPPPVFSSTLDRKTAAGFLIPCHAAPFVQITFRCVASRRCCSLHSNEMEYFISLVA